jgi:hypothetical protein
VGAPVKAINVTLLIAVIVILGLLFYATVGRTM